VYFRTALYVDERVKRLAVYPIDVVVNSKASYIPDWSLPWQTALSFSEAVCALMMTRTRNASLLSSITRLTSLERSISRWRTAIGA
jgi:hypothetical protein